MARTRLPLTILLTALVAWLVPGAASSDAQVDPARAVVWTIGLVDLGSGPADLTHIRRELGFSGLQIHLAAARDFRTLECRVQTGAAGLALRARENALEGRGFVGAGVNVTRGQGTVVLASQDVETVGCEMSFPHDGRFHRVGSVLLGRLPAEIVATDASGTAVFHHMYCLAVVGTWVPLLPQFTTAEVMLSGAGNAGACPPDDIPGRTVNDQNEHG